MDSEKYSSRGIGICPNDGNLKSILDLVCGL